MPPEHIRELTFSSRILLFLSILVLPIHSNAQCTSSSGCFPQPGNLATSRTIQTDSECSSNDTYCIYNTLNCFLCNSSSSTENINDGNPSTAWISEIGPSSNTTMLRLDFEAPVLFDSMTMRWNSVRPQSMVLERSHDNGDTWVPYRYYSASCRSRFMREHQDTLTPELVFNSTDAVCTQSQWQISPPTGAEVRT